MTDCLGAGWRFCGQQRLGSSLAAFLVESPFPWSRRHAPGARSAALRGQWHLQLSGPRGRVHPRSPLPPPPDGAPWRVPDPGHGGAKRLVQSDSAYLCTRRCRPGSERPAGLRAAQLGPPGRLPVSCVPKTRGHSLIPAVGCNFRAGKERSQGRGGREASQHISEAVHCQDIGYLFGQTFLQGGRSTLCPCYHL